MKKECVILFAKYPARGKVKTRLTPFLNKTRALKLYVSMLSCAIGVLKKSGQDIVVYCYPRGSANAFQRSYCKNMDCRGQNGKDLGERMKNAFLDAFGAGCERAVLVGCDIPGLSVNILRKAFRGLKNKGIAIGPAKDGGYYLIGFKKECFVADIFTGIAWGGPSVFDDTLNIIKKNNLKAAVLPALRDVDTASDLKFFAGRGRRGSQLGQAFMSVKS